MAGKFEIYEDRAVKYRFRLKAGYGEAYESKAAAIKGTAAVQRAATDAEVKDLTAWGRPARPLRRCRVPAVLQRPYSGAPPRCSPNCTAVY